MNLAVIIASCNREERAFSTARSLLQMGIEVIVVDDGSTMPYPGSDIQTGLRLLRLPVNSGPSAARNHGARSTQAEWLIFLDDDDKLDPSLTEWIGKQDERRLKELDLVHFGHRTEEPNSSSISVTLSSHEKPSVLAGSWMMRREFFMRIGGYEERLRYSENSDLVERAALAGARTLHAGFPSLSYTIGRPRRREEMAARRAEACIFYLNNRPCNRRQTLKIGLMNSWWDRNPLLGLRLVAAFLMAHMK